MYQYIYKGSGLATYNGILSPYVQYVSQSVGRGWDNPLMSERKSQKCRKLPYGGLAAVSPFVLRELRLRGIAARAPAFPKRADSSRAGRGCPLLSRLQTPARGMACRSARYLAYHMKAPDGPLDWPTAVRTSPQPRICSRQCLPMLYTLSKTPTQFPDYIAGRTRDG